MKLIAGDIKLSKFGCASANVGVEAGTYPYLRFSICTMDVSVPLVEGKVLEQYKEELLAKARERIASMYKEIICGGEINDAIDIIVRGKLNGEYKIRVVNKNGKLSAVGTEDGSSDDDLEKRIASIENQLSGSLNTGALNAIYAVGKKAAEDFMGKSGDEGLWDMGFRIEDREGVLVVCDENGESEPTSEHRDKIIEMAISMLRSGNRNMLKRLGRAMGLLQVAAEIEANNQLHGSARRGDVLRDFDNPPFKKLPDDWISPGVEYLKTRLDEGAREDELIISSIYDVASKAAADFIASRKQELFQK
ncbi:hypothetical protein BSY47_003769 [Salmonella enterica subsp. enterica serovar Adelaide]|nr:hypothetical protein [Salmonella enterica subsp. enterica]EDX3511649.1 hypothetical protein [Salmonella enterica subsp. enterica serovar Adelaide]HAF1587650.1 hypothetical protein [Salmonella enterica]HAF4896177.1 hypothetical protein [Salmonella enterica]HAG2478165.1 hypothetical protein [Salmonella enterica]